MGDGARPEARMGDGGTGQSLGVLGGEMVSPVPLRWAEAQNLGGKAGADPQPLETQLGSAFHLSLLSLQASEEDGACLRDPEGDVTPGPPLPVSGEGPGLSEFISW